MRDWLIAIRKDDKKTQREIAILSGISAPSYCNIESGKINPSVCTAKRIAHVLGFDWTQFYDDDDLFADERGAGTQE